MTNTLQFNLTEVMKNDNTNDQASAKFYGIKTKPCKKILWNEFLLNPIAKKVSHFWIVNLIHGYLSQSNILFLIRKLNIFLNKIFKCKNSVFP